jgi:hypothetical protein
VAKTLSAAVPRKLQFPKAKAPSSKRQIPISNEISMTKANTGGWTCSEDRALGFPWDLGLGFWNFPGARTSGFVWSLDIGVWSFFEHWRLEFSSDDLCF